MGRAPTCFGEIIDICKCLGTGFPPTEDSVPVHKQQELMNKKSRWLAWFVAIAATAGL